MSAFSLSGSGTHALTAGTTALHVDITTIPSTRTIGRANPTNYFGIALLRFGDGTAYWEPLPVEGGPQWFGVPIGSTTVGYACLNGAVLNVTEVIGGPSPFGGGTSAPTLLSSFVAANNTTPSLVISGGPWTLYDRLEISYRVRGTAAGTDQLFLMRFNGDTASNYNAQDWSATGTASTVPAAAIQVGNVPCAGNSASHVGSGLIRIHGPNDTNWFKTVVTEHRVGDQLLRGETNTGEWKSIAQITSITLTPPTAFAQNSVIRFYGIP